MKQIRIAKLANVLPTTAKEFETSAVQYKDIEAIMKKSSLIYTPPIVTSQGELCFDGGYPVYAWQLVDCHGFHAWRINDGDIQHTICAIPKKQYDLGIPDAPEERFSWLVSHSNLIKRLEHCKTCKRIFVSGISEDRPEIEKCSHC